MCGRFALDQTSDQLIAAFLVQENRFPNWAPHWNIAPTSTIPMVIQSKPEGVVLEAARWSLVPPWAKDLKLPYPTFNARSESAGEKPTFRHALKKSRCIIPARGYYEWTSENGVKTPHFIHDPQASLLLFAGLYSWWQGAEHPNPIATTTIMTMDSAGPLATIHSRMPVLVARDFLPAWLDPDNLHGAELIQETRTSTHRFVTNLQVNPVASPSREAVAAVRSGSD
jgi:putative SOS response-associated peptidase YedK